MLTRLLEFIKEHSLLHKGQKLLLAVSGGIDSMVMWHIFRELGEIEYAIAHCNFRLRGDESDKDQEFVRSLAKKEGKDFYTVNFNTRQYAIEKSLSIQMAARELRYNWFSELAKAHRFDRIAVAHNQNDVVETMIINLVRGTGIKGLTGIKVKSGIIIRPMLFATRRDIETYAKLKGIEYREDSSNAEVKYKRNLIRHQILPLFQKLNPSFRETLLQESEIFTLTWKGYQRYIESLKQVCFQKKGSRFFIDISKLINLKINSAILYDMLSEFEFSYAVVKDIFKSLNSESGRKFYSSNYVLLKDRENLIIERVNETMVESTFQITQSMNEVNYPIQLRIHKFERSNDFSWPKSVSMATLDMDRLKYPLTLRHWQEGDYFYPVGLGGKKKLSDFFIDNKIDLLEKQRIWLLTSGNEIVWIIGYRIDDRFKITPATKNILMLEIKD